MSCYSATSVKYPDNWAGAQNIGPGYTQDALPERQNWSRNVSEGEV